MIHVQFLMNLHRDYVFCFKYLLVLRILMLKEKKQLQEKLLD